MARRSASSRKRAQASYALAQCSSSFRGALSGITSQWLSSPRAATLLGESRVPSSSYASVSPGKVPGCASVNRQWRGRPGAWLRPKVETLGCSGPICPSVQAPVLGFACGGKRGSTPVVRNQHPSTWTYVQQGCSGPHFSEPSVALGNIVVLGAQRRLM